MRLILLLTIFLSGTVFAEPPAEVSYEIKRLSDRMNALGDIDEFALFVAKTIEKDGCSTLVDHVSPNSEYFGDPEYFYAKCLYESRHFGSLSDYRPGRRSFEVVRQDGLPPFKPTIRILYGEGANERYITLYVDLEQEEYKLLDLWFVYGGPRKYVRPASQP